MLKSELIKHGKLFYGGDFSIMGIANSAEPKKIVGARIREARLGAGLSRADMCERLSFSSIAPPAFSRGDKTLNEDTYKQWELGNNPVGIEWFPAICETLDCDAGYLFGEYQQLKRVTADVCATTGLSVDAVNKLTAEANGWQKISHSLTAGMTAPSDILSKILADPDFWRALNHLSQCTNPVIEEQMNLADEINGAFINAPREANSEMTPLADPMREVNVVSVAMRVAEVARRAIGWDTKK